eukprot:TRINITY_DN2097_c2_g2_i2.p1 TRINITY_DN2097_c2_g2~~TRINITY_DN2097_c2_g2_i2.p1  ORF type:complete len:343 (+),score=89.80 TRINITY_DN2097_c2_g2_i2:83-1111(+)
MSLQAPFAVRSTIDVHHEVMAVGFSPDELLVGAACADGIVRCYDAHSGASSYAVDTMLKQADKIPATCMRFRPDREGKTRNIAIVGTAAGELQHWHLSSKKLVHNITEPENEIYAVDFRPDGEQFATAGKDHRVRLYSEETRQETQCLQWGASQLYPEPMTAHSSRVQAVRYVPGDPFRMVSAGWDRTVQLWDTRQDQATEYLYGPYVCGDAVDVHNDGRTLVTGSCRDEEQLQVWDLANTKEPCAVIPLPPGPDEHPMHVYSVQFRPSGPGQFCAVGGTAGVHVCDVRTQTPVPGRYVPHGFHAVFSVCWSRDSQTLAAAGTSGVVALSSEVRLSGRGPRI